MATIEVNKIGGGGASAYGDLTGVPITRYAVTTADAENTTDPTIVASFTVPANTWNNRERIDIEWLCELNNGTAGAVSYNPKIVVDGENNPIVSSTMVALGAAILSYGMLSFFREGDDIYIIDEINTQNRISAPVIFKLFNSQIGTGSILENGATHIYNYTSGSYTFDFTKDLDIGLQINFGAADASVYWRMIEGIAYKRERI